MKTDKGIFDHFFRKAQKPTPTESHNQHVQYWLDADRNAEERVAKYDEIIIFLTDLESLTTNKGPASMYLNHFKTLRDCYKQYQNDPLDLQYIYLKEILHSPDRLNRELQLDRLVARINLEVQMFVACQRLCKRGFDHCQHRSNLLKDIVNDSSLQMYTELLTSMHTDLGIGITCMEVCRTMASLEHFLAMAVGNDAATKARNDGYFAWQYLALDDLDNRKRRKKP